MARSAGNNHINITVCGDADDSYYTQDPNDPNDDGILRYEYFRTQILLGEVPRCNERAFMSKDIALLMLGLFIAGLVCAVPASAVPTPLPGQGNQTGILFGVHPNAKKNETITTFIAEHGEIWWHEGAYNHTHEYVYIVPANACEEQLVYLNRIRADEHNGEPSIEYIRIIGCNETLPLGAELRFPEIFEKYPALGNDKELRSYIENRSPPDRYEEYTTTRPSRTWVYFIKDTGIFTEYIVELARGEIVSTTYVSEEDLTVGRSEAVAQALSGQPQGARVEKIVLKVLDDDIVWEVAVRAGSETENVQVPSDLEPGHSLQRTTPGFGAIFAAFGIGMSFVLHRRRRTDLLLCCC